MTVVPTNCQAMTTTSTSPFHPHMMQERQLLRPGGQFCCILGILCLMQVARAQDNHNITTRIGWKYLGYYLTALGASTFGGRGIQTPVTTTVRPVLPPLQTIATNPPIFITQPPLNTFPTEPPLPTPPPLNTFPTAPPPGSNLPLNTFATAPPPSFNTFPTAPPVVIPTTLRPTFPTVNTNSPQVQPFPTAPPVSLPTGIVSQVSPPSIAQTLFPVAPVTGTAAIQCTCVAAGTCLSQARSGTDIDLRVVTTPPAGVQCPAGQVYCCNQIPGQTCGLPNVLPGPTPQAGQANFGEYPWSVIVLSTANQYVGGGALVSSQHILTVAHRVAAYANAPGNLKIRLGDWDRSQENEPFRSLEVPVVRIVIHPNFNPQTLASDVAVITMGAGVPFLTATYPQINSICLPSATDVFTGARCWVAGWGQDQFNGNLQTIIKEVELPVIDPANCQALLRQVPRLGPSWNLDANSFICAGGEPSRDSCTGDGGNALACQRNGRFFIAGITAGGIECGIGGIPGLYVNLAANMAWISAQMGVTTTTGTIDPRRQPAALESSATTH